MKITNTLYVTTRQEWRDWLAAHYQSEAEVWLIYYRKATGKARIPYNTAVEEALCCGWIDSINKGMDEERLAQRFTPRKLKSDYSQTNIERLRKLVAAGRVMPEVQASLSDLLTQEFDYPEDIVAALRAHDEAWRNFQRYAGSYQRIRIAYVETARKRPGEFEKRLNNLIQKTAQNKQFGFGIEEYY